MTYSPSNPIPTTHPLIHQDMELCSLNMSESGGSLCQVKQLPRPNVRLQASGCSMQNLPNLLHQPWVNQPALKIVPSPAVALRVNGAVTSSCSRKYCVAPKLGEQSALAPCISKGKVLVTGGGGYFGYRLGTELASQGMSVILLDVNKAPSDIPAGAIYYQVWVI